ncbi:glycosyltransferase family 4 protein [Proteiniborus sp. MB09-C3]|uniref:glycosyltransferase family 4 protein n=1 Tax=Proteiniborus sp. MB09-C3 TaxID=3050072 RepID=UPI002555EB54|nr:glycosyltransferase family 4 protein [Proteiniborus sp. MB09-C3]WIV12079.1 glycosyltransferase family 4 protein [Proteiniborus sp. MB09-C3]
MKRIWIVAPFADIDIVGVRDRFQYLANRLNIEGMEVILFTNDFSHMKKQHIDIQVSKEYPYRVEIIHEAGYKKNVSMKRIISHIEFACNIKKLIKRMPKPDVIYSAYPTMSAAHAVGRYARKNKIPFIIDIQDTWPESISSAIDTEKLLVKLLMWPFTKLANRIYKMADGVIGVSKTYAERANVKGTRCKVFIPVYIGAELEKFDAVLSKEEKINKNEQDIWVTYIGTLSHSYDIDTAIKAFAQLKKCKNIKLNILGTGPDDIRLIKLARELGVYDKNVYFYGFIKYEKMIHILKKSDIALNAIRGSAKQTITNKLSDYVSSGLPILNSCQEKEVLDLINNKEIGINYVPEDINSLRDSILKMISCKETMKKYSRNSRLLAEKCFDRKVSYNAIVDLVKEISAKDNQSCEV